MKRSFASTKGTHFKNCAGFLFEVGGKIPRLNKSRTRFSLGLMDVAELRTL